MESWGYLFKGVAYKILNILNNEEAFTIHIFFFICLCECVIFKTN